MINHSRRHLCTAVSTCELGITVVPNTHLLIARSKDADDLGLANERILFTHLQRACAQTSAKVLLIFCLVPGPRNCHWNHFHKRYPSDHELSLPQVHELADRQFLRLVPGPLCFFFEIRILETLSVTNSDIVKHSWSLYRDGPFSFFEGRRTPTLSFNRRL